MRPIDRLSSLAFVTLVLTATPTLARGAPSDAVVSSDERVVLAARAVADDRSARGLRPITLAHRATLELPAAADTLTTIRFEQRHRGLEVEGAAVSVRLRQDGAAPIVVARVFEDIDVDAVPVVDEETARRVARGAAEDPRWVGRVALVVQPAPRPGRLVWRVDLVDRLGAARVRVDASTGRVVGVDRRTRHVDGRVYAQNQTTTPVPVDVELHDLDIAVPQRLDGWNGLLHVTQHGGGDLFDPAVVQTLTTDASGSFLYDPPADATDATDAFAQVNVHHHLTEMRRFYSALGVDMTSPEWSLKAIVNATQAGEPLDNAFYLPTDGDPGPFAANNWIVMGQGSITDFGYDADVIKHELGHYVGERAIGYNLGFVNVTPHGLSPFSAAIDEGMSDYFAASDNGDPLAGEGAPGSLGLTRDLSDTSLRCPDDLAGEPHADGLLAGSLSWSLRELLGPDAADPLMFGALSLATPGLSFGDLGHAILLTADDLVAAGTLSAADRQAIVGVLEDRGVLGCFPEIELIPNEARSLQVVGLDTVERWFGVGPCDFLEEQGVEFPPLFQPYADTGANYDGIRFVVEVSGDPVGAPARVRLLVRKGEAPGFAQNDVGGVPLPSATTYEREILVEAGAPATLEIDATSTPAFEPGARYYVSFTNPSCAGAKVTVRAEPTSVELPSSNVVSVSAVSSASATSTNTGAGGAGGDGGAGGAGGGGDVEIVGGCGCGVTTSEPSPWRILVLAVAIATAARRRRRR